VKIASRAEKEVPFVCPATSAVNHISGITVVSGTAICPENLTARRAFYQDE
jgi:hypothetical protein